MVMLLVGYHIKLVYDKATKGYKSFILKFYLFMIITYSVVTIIIASEFSFHLHHSLGRPLEHSIIITPK